MKLTELRTCLEYKAIFLTIGTISKDFKMEDYTLEVYYSPDLIVG